MAEELGSSTVLKSRNEKARKELVGHAINTTRASQLMSGGIMGLLASTDTKRKNQQNAEKTKKALEKLGEQVKKDGSVHWIYSQRAEAFITACIFVNAGQIGAETDHPCQSRRGEPCTSDELAIFLYMELFFMLVFFSEMCIKIKLERGVQQVKDFILKPPSWQAIVGMPVKDGTNLKTEDPKGSEGSESSESSKNSKNSKNSEGSGSDSGSSSSEAEKQGKLGRSPEEKKRKEVKKKQQRYFNDFFNVFDFFIVWMSVFDLFGAEIIPGASSMRVLRIFRVVRLLRTLRFVQPLWIIVVGLIDTLKAMFWCFVLLAAWCYMMAAYTTNFFGHDDETPYPFHQFLVKPDPVGNLPPDAPRQWTKDNFFGTIPRSMLSVFQVATLSNWSTNITRPLIKYNGTVLVPILLFICVARYGLLNVAVGYIVECTARNTRKQAKLVNPLLAEAERYVMASIVKGVKKLDEFGRLDREVLFEHLDTAPVIRNFRYINIWPHEAKELYESCSCCEPDPNFCSTERFCEGLYELKGDGRALQCFKISKLAQNMNRSGVRCMKSGKRTAEMVDEIFDRVEELYVKLRPDVPEVPEQIAMQVKSNLKLVNNFFQDIFGVVMVVEYDKLTEKDKLVEQDKLKTWLELLRYSEEKEDLEMLRLSKAPVQEVRSMLDVRGRLHEWLREHNITVRTLQGLEAWVKEARRYLRELNLQSRSVSHASAWTGGFSTPYTSERMYSSNTYRRPIASPKSDSVRSRSSENFRNGQNFRVGRPPPSRPVSRTVSGRERHVPREGPLRLGERLSQSAHGRERGASAPTDDAARRNAARRRRQELRKGAPGEAPRSPGGAAVARKKAAAKASPSRSRAANTSTSLHGAEAAVDFAAKPSGIHGGTSDVVLGATRNWVKDRLKTQLKTRETY